ncbi:MAG: hypothetical protein ABSG43_19790 [Solirubrobacteraceae bacterium]
MTGGHETITPSPLVAEYLVGHGISVTGIGAATVVAGKMTMPMVGGTLAVPSMRGVMTADGGVQFSGPLRTLQMRDFKLSHTGKGAQLSAVIDGKRIVLARMPAAEVKMSGKSGKMTGGLRLSAAWANRINQIVGKHVFSAGAAIGNLSALVKVA